MVTERDRVLDGSLLSQVKPSFMIPAIGMSVFGGLLAPTLSLALAALHAVAVGTALYTAHVVDEYVDAHIRGEERPVLTKRRVKAAIIGVSAVCLGLTGVLGLIGRQITAVTVLVLWLFAALHAPVFDKNTIAVTADYPIGIALVLVGGYLCQHHSLPPAVIGIATIFVVVLAAVKISIDRLDLVFDRSIDKRTVPVVLGERRATLVSGFLFVCAIGLVSGLVISSILPAASLLTVPVLFIGAVLARGASAERVVRLQMGLVYPLAVILFVTGCVVTNCVVKPSIIDLLGGI